LASQTSVADATRPELLLATSTGAVAGLVRHHAPQLLEALGREGWKFTGIRIRVQVRPASADISKVYAKEMDPLAAAALLAGAEGIGDRGLAAALRRLAGRSARESRGKEQPLEGVEKEHARKEK
jgi:hypothetical protein